MLHHNLMALSLTDPLALSSGVASRLVLAGGVAVVLWAAVAWALAA